MASPPADPTDVLATARRPSPRPASDNTVRFSGVQANMIGGITTQSIPFLGNVAVMLVRVPTGAVTGDLTIEAYGKVSNG